MTVERPLAAAFNTPPATPAGGDDELYLALRAAGASLEEAVSCLEAECEPEFTWEPRP